MAFRHWALYNCCSIGKMWRQYKFGCNKNYKHKEQESFRLTKLNKVKGIAGFSWNAGSKFMLISILFLYFKKCNAVLLASSAYTVYNICLMWILCWSSLNKNDDYCRCPIKTTDEEYKVNYLFFWKILWGCTLFYQKSFFSQSAHCQKSGKD